VLFRVEYFGKENKMPTSEQNDTLLKAHDNDTVSPTRAVALIRHLDDPGSPSLSEQFNLCELFCRENGLSLQIIIEDETNSGTGLSTKVLEAYETCKQDTDLSYLLTYSPRLFGPSFTDFAAFQMGFRELDTLLLFMESHPPLCKESPHQHETAKSRPNTKDRPQVTSCY